MSNFRNLKTTTLPPKGPVAKVFHALPKPMFRSNITTTCLMAMFIMLTTTAVGQSDLIQRIIRESEKIHVPRSQQWHNSCRRRLTKFTRENQKDDERVVTIRGLKKAKRGHMLGFRESIHDGKYYIKVLHSRLTKWGSRVAVFHLNELRAFNGERTPDYTEGGARQRLKEWLDAEIKKWEDSMPEDPDETFSVQLVVGPKRPRACGCFTPLACDEPFEGLREVNKSGEDDLGDDCDTCGAPDTIRPRYRTWTGDDWCYFTVCKRCYEAMADA